MEFSIRPMVVDDYDEVFQLWESAEGIVLSETDAKEPMLRFLRRNPGLSFVAVLGGELVGTVLCSHDGRRGYLHHLAVDDRYRRRGVGSALVHASLWALSKEQITKCNIFIMEENDAGMAFWRQNGFRLLEHFGWMQKQIIGDEKPPRELSHE